MNTRNILCQQAVDFISREPFSRCLQSFLSICQTLLFHKLAKLGYKRISLFACLWSNLHFPRSPFWVFNPEIPFLVMSPFSSFQLDLYFSFSFFFTFLFHFLWFKLSFRVFTLNLFFFLFLPKPPFRVFNFDKSFWWPQA